jgi:hypothetical protein
MLGQELDDALLGVNLVGARGCTASARSPSGGAAPRASWRCRGCSVVVRLELLDLLFEPGGTLLEIRTSASGVSITCLMRDICCSLFERIYSGWCPRLAVHGYVNARSK